MNKRRICALFLVLTLSLAGCGAGTKKTEESSTLNEGAYLEKEADRVSSIFVEGEYPLYYTTESRDSIQEKKVELDFSDTSVEDEVDRILQLLSENGTDTVSVIPDGLKLEYEIQKEDRSYVLRLYMNDIYLRMPPNEAVIFRTGLSKSIFGLGHINRIEYYAPSDERDDPLNYSYADDQVLLNRYDQNFYTDEIMLSLYFANEEETALVEERRKVTLSLTDKLQETVVSELIRGPEEEGHQKLIPEGTQIQSIWIKDEVCYVDLNGIFINRFFKSPQVGELVVYSIVNSISGLLGIQYVQILIDGERVDEYAPGVPINAVLTANPDLVEKE